MEAMRTVAGLMEISAITAPKAVGQNFVVTATIEGDDIKRLAADMAAYGDESGKKNFDRDGANVANSSAVFLVGLKDATAPGLNCAACGPHLDRRDAPTTTMDARGGGQRRSPGGPIHLRRVRGALARGEL